MNQMGHTSTAVNDLYLVTESEDYARREKLVAALQERLIGKPVGGPTASVKFDGFCGHNAAKLCQLPLLQCRHLYSYRFFVNEMESNRLLKTPHIGPKSLRGNAGILRILRAECGKEFRQIAPVGLLEWNEPA